MNKKIEKQLQRLGIMVAEDNLELEKQITTLKCTLLTRDKQIMTLKLEVELLQSALDDTYETHDE